MTTARTDFRTSRLPREQRPQTYQSRGPGVSVLGLLALGVAAYVGMKILPDLIRYIRIERM